MAYPAYVREKARELRLERRLSIVEIAERLALPKTTIFCWVRDIPLQRPRRGNTAERRRYRERREAAYAQGRSEFDELAKIPTFRDFVCLYIACSTDQDVDELAHFWARIVDIEPDEVSLQRKSNSNQLRKRTWRSQHGVLTVRARDTLLRARLQGWIDCLRESWLHSPDSGA